VSLERFISHVASCAYHQPAHFDMSHLWSLAIMYASSNHNLPKWIKEGRPLRSLKRPDRYLNFGTQKIGIIATQSKRQWHMTTLLRNWKCWSPMLLGSVVKKLNNLRSTFRKELKKVNNSKQSGTSADDLYIPSLLYYNELMVLVNQETPDKSLLTVGGLPVEGDEDENNQCTVSVNQLTLFTN